MVKFKDVQFEALGEFIQDLIKDPGKQAVFRNKDQTQMKELLRGFMTPRDKTWEEITIVAHFDQDLIVNIAFPFTGDVEQTIATIAPADGPGEDYTFPDHYNLDPNAGPPDQIKKNRLSAYHKRLGDYVMSRCK
ncbi:hypothetical protein A9K65_014290 [Mesorhizobium sp. WSM1497]|uniref:hypothetical protein n=1 Tax=Mesorhizobium sp. WSM1497 TaxID=278153 RepID=UPI000A06FC94|nr:hypothetical protein [Mesorhizobium sp. WSM1497]ARP67756.1 hypothetical protein A9K65_014290 [Mesorhizobium sp. WSM1497]